MKTMTLGAAGPAVSRVGLGCMAMSGVYGPADEADSIATIHAALDAGVTFLDTGDFYGMGHNEMLIGRAIAGRRDRVFLSVKFGMQRGPSGPPLGYSASPAAVKTALAYTLRRLGTDHVDLYQPARVDRNVPVEETMGAIGDMIRAGHVRYAGVSEVSAATLRRAHAACPVTALQMEYSLACREAEDGILPLLRELGGGLVAYGVFARGLLTGAIAPDGAFAPGDTRNDTPRFSGEHLARNLAVVAGLKAIAAEAGLTPGQLALGWVLARGDGILPLVGARRPARIAEAAAMVERPLPADVLAAIDAAVPRAAFSGARYPAAHIGSVGL